MGVRDEINGTITAMRSGMTPRRAQTPKPPSEVAAAVAKAKSASRAIIGNVNSALSGSGKEKGNSKSKNKGQLPIGLPARLGAEEAAQSLTQGAASKVESKKTDGSRNTKDYQSATVATCPPPPRKNSYSLGAGGAQLASKQRYVDVLGDIQRSNSGG